MFAIKFIDNIILKDGYLFAEGRMGYPTKVFMRQGCLDKACGIYSLLMLLILHKKINREDLTKETCSRDPPDVKSLKKILLRPLKGIKTNGTTMNELRDMLLKIYDFLIPVNTYVIRNSNNREAEAKTLHSIIKGQLDKGLPVLLGYSTPGHHGHAVVGIGYSICEDVLRLYCLDPGALLPWASVWNNIIDVDLNNDNKEWPDYNYRSEEKINIDEVLLIEDYERMDTALPF